MDGPGPGAGGEASAFQATLDRMSANVAVLDSDGSVPATNRAWKAFGARNGASENVGANYLDVCSAAAGDPWAERALVELEALLSGASARADMTYPCTGSAAQGWFAMSARRLGGPGPVRLLVAHRPAHDSADAGGARPATPDVRGDAGGAQEGLLRPTARELEVLTLVAQGLTSGEIARRLSIAPATARAHVEHIRAKLGVRDRTAAVAMALRTGMIR